MSSNEVTSQGRYRIRIVSEMTGVPAPTLRAWERRYGIPAPQRTASAYRLYSDEDVDLVKRLVALCGQGLSPSEAARQLKSGPPRPAPAKPAPPPAEPPSPEVWRGAVDRILAAVDTFDPEALTEATRHALCLGPARAVFENVFAPAQHEVGNRWHTGRLSVAHEHLASEHLTGVARDLLKMMQPASDDRLALLACFDEEQHVLPLYSSALYFVEWGFRTVIMGARTPPEALAEAIARLQPTLVGLSVTVPPIAAERASLLDRYATACATRPWVVGGRAAEAMREGLESRGATVVGADLGALRATLEQLTQ